jgi:Lrp/AsnC family transcriptional regulator, leucine-responsive regulatory protein
MIKKLDPKDIDILNEIQSNDISNQDLADKVGLSPSPCSRRVQQLEKDGIIKRQVAILNPEKLGLQLTILVLVGLDNHSPKAIASFEEAIESLPEIIECHLITGQTADYQLKIIVPDIPYFENLLLKKLTRINDVSSVQSSFVLRSIKNETALPLNHLKQDRH